MDGLNILPLLRGEANEELTQRTLCFQRNRYAPVAHSNAAIRRGRWKLYWPGDQATLKKDIGRDNPSYQRGVINPHWEMPLDRELAPATTAKQPPAQLFDLAKDPAEKQDLAASHPAIVTELTELHDSWFADVLPEWHISRREILSHDREYWSKRDAPDPTALFDDFWQWSKAPPGTEPDTADPLRVFTGYWTPEPRSIGDSNHAK